MGNEIAPEEAAVAGKGTNHFVFGTPLDYSEAKDANGRDLEVAVFATGCFWGSEKFFWRLPFGVHSTAVGYTAGSVENPTYGAVCSGLTGHAECVQVIYDPEQISFVDLLRGFWQSHDPTQGDGQGNDRGSQYRSGIYYTTSEQKKLALASRDAYDKALRQAGKGRGDGITTQIAELDVFYFAEKYHQQYLARPNSRQYCSASPTGIQLPPPETWIPEEYQTDQYMPKLSEEFWNEHGPVEGCVLFVPNEPISWEQ